MNTNGQILYYNNGRKALNKEDNDDVLTLKSGLPSWEAAAGGGALTNLGSTTLTGDGDSIAVTLSESMNFLMLYVHCVGSGAIAGRLRFNDDSGNNYSYLNSNNFGSADSAINQNMANPANQDPPDDTDIFFTMFGSSYAADEKAFYSHMNQPNTAGAGTAPNSTENAFKWVNTSAQITKVDIINGGAGSFAAGSELVVLGTD